MEFARYCTKAMLQSADALPHIGKLMMPLARLRLDRCRSRPGDSSECFWHVDIVVRACVRACTHVCVAAVCHLFGRRHSQHLFGSKGAPCQAKVHGTSFV